MSNFPSQPISFDQVGGVKVDYVAVVDPSTDRSADEMNLAFDTTAMMSEMIPQARVQFTSGTLTDPWVLSHRALWGSSISVVPILSHSLPGVYTVTWPATVDTGLATTAVNFSEGSGCFASGSKAGGGTACGFVNVDLASANVATIYTFNSSGVASDMSGSKINIKVW